MTNGEHENTENDPERLLDVPPGAIDWPMSDFSDWGDLEMEIEDQDPETLKTRREHERQLAEQGIELFSTTPDDE